RPAPLVPLLPLVPLVPLVPRVPRALGQWVQLLRLGQPGLRRLLLRRQVLAVAMGVPRASQSVAPQHPRQALEQPARDIVDWAERSTNPIVPDASAALPIQRDSVAGRSSRE